MNSWTPLWSTVVESSLWEEDDFVVKVFLTMLAKKDADHVVRGDAYRIGKWALKSEEETEKALKILAAPDKRRRSEQEHEGRRIKRVEDGWLVLNGPKYREMIQKLKRKEYKRTWQAEKRSKSVSSEYRQNEAKFVKAYEDGDQEGMDRASGT